MWELRRNFRLLVIFSSGCELKRYGNQGFVPLFFCVTNPGGHSVSYIEREASFYCWCNRLRRFGVSAGVVNAWTPRCGLFRAGWEFRLPSGCDRLEGNALDQRPREFREIDIRSLEVSVEVAVRRGVKHFVFVSVARSAPVMKPYQEVRAQCEELIIKAGLSTTILRPWYIPGPGHRWPLVLIPIYSIAERFGATRAGALRLGLVRHHEMVRALANVVEGPPPAGQRYIDVPGIRAA